MSIKSVMPCNHLILFSSCLQSFPASGSFPMSQLFPSGGQSFGVSALASVLSMNIQDWVPFELTHWVSLQSKGLSRDFSNTTVQNHQVFGAQLSLESNSHIPSWLLKKTKWLSEGALQIAVKRREVKSKGEKERYTHLNAEFQRIARRDKKAFQGEQWKK